MEGGAAPKKMGKRKPEYPQPGLLKNITSALLKLRDHELWGPKLSDQWLPAGTWREALSLARLMDPSFAIEDWDFNRAMSHKHSPWRVSMNWFDGTNTTGVFRVVSGSKMVKMYYYVTEPGKQVSYPCPLDSDWKTCVAAAGEQALILPVASETDTSPQPAAPGALKRKRDPVPPASVLSQNFWEQTEARKLFGPRDDDETVQETLLRRIQQLRLVNASNDGWRKVIARHGRDNPCSMNDIFEIRQRCAFLCQAYIYALEKMNS